jgi:hypothetical protein
MPNVNYVSPLAVEDPCPETTCDGVTTTYTYRAILNKTLIANQKITLVGRCGTTDFVPAPPGAGFANVAAALAWAQANWAAYGTFSALGANGIKLVSQTCEKGFLDIPLLVQTFCFNITDLVDDGPEFNAIKHNNLVVELGKEVTAATSQQVIDQIKDFFADGVLSVQDCPDPGDKRIKYVGTGVPLSIGNVAATVYTAVTSFAAAGACPAC